MILTCGHCIECCSPTPPTDLPPLPPQAQASRVIGCLKVHNNSSVYYKDEWNNSGNKMGLGASRMCSSWYEYRSLESSINIMPSPIRQRRGLPCLSLIQLPKKRTNVDPKKHNKIQRLYVCGEEVNASGKRYRPVEMETDSGYHQHEQPQLRPLDHNQYSHEHYQQQQYRTYGNSRPAEYQRPFMTGSKVGISYFLMGMGSQMRHAQGKWGRRSVSPPSVLQVDSNL